MTLGELVRKARQRKGWSLRDLERETGIKNPTLCWIENGHTKDPSWRNVVKIAKALNLKLNRLAECEPPPAP